MKAAAAAAAVVWRDAELVERFLSNWFPCCSCVCVCAAILLHSGAGFVVGRCDDLGTSVLQLTEIQNN